MDERRSLDATAYGSMLFFCMAMGLQAISLKVISEDVAPIMQIVLRSGLAGILAIVYMRLGSTNFALVKSAWWPGFITGLFFALEYVFVGEALRFTTAARVTVFLYTAPLFSALILHFCKKSERLSLWQWVGVIVTFGGVILAFWEVVPQGEGVQYPFMLFGDILALMGGLAWAVVIIALRLSRLQSMPPTVTLFYQLGFTFVILWAFAIISGQSSLTPTVFVFINLAYQTFFISFGFTLLWLWLIKKYAATRISILSFLTPLFTLGFAIILLDEPVEPHLIMGAVLVVGGLVMISVSKNIDKKLEITMKID